MGAELGLAKLGRSPIDYAAQWGRLVPERDALVFEGARISYGELDRRAARVAAYLSGELGLKRGDRVALLAYNHPVFFDLAFACLRLGLVLAPINYRLTAREIGQLWELAEPRVLIADAECMALAREACGGDARLIGVDELSDLEPVADGHTTDLAGAQMEDPAFLLFTSGTTGLPKAAVLPVRQVFWNALNTQAAWELRRDDTTILYTPLFHTGAINVLAMPLLALGGRVVIQRAFDAAAVVADITRWKVSALFGVPTTFQMLESDPGLTEALETVRMLVSGGAPLPIALIERYRERGVTLLQGFGMTEVGPNCFYLPRERAFEKAGSVGLPMPYGAARILVDGREAQTGEVGQLEIAGPHLSAGYFRNPAATEASLVDGWLRTGDLAKIDEDGFYTIAGRAKDMFISGGENVYPAEVEGALAGHPAVVESAVVAVPDETWGEVGCAFVVVNERGADAVELTGFLRGQLARYKVPRRFAFPHALPKNESGKVQKAQLVQEAVAS